jgi:hypothetical protein
MTIARQAEAAGEEGGLAGTRHGLGFTHGRAAPTIRRF